MLDIKFVLQNLELIKQNAENRNVKVDLDKIASVYEERKLLQQEIDELRSERNVIAKDMTSCSAENRPVLVERSKEIKEALATKEKRFKELDESFTSEFMKVPNLTHPDSPLGKSEDYNREIYRYKEPTQFSFKPKDHVEIGQDLDLIDFELGTKVSGSKFYFLKNEAVLLEYAITKFAIDALIKEGFTLISTPDLAKMEIVEGIGYNPRGSEAQIYSLNNSDLCLIGTAEITLGGMLANSVIDEQDLPKKFVGISHCFRTEAGAYGSFSKGLYRVHQFTKIEMFAFTTPEKSEETHEYFKGLEESLFRALDIPFRTIDICVGDLGGPAYRKYDLEAWMPGRRGDDENTNGNWGEVTSTSNCTDYQSRRLNIKYKSKETGKTEYLHMLNGTAFAISRTLISILENYQQSDGSVLVPKVLQPYLGFDVIKR